MMRNPAFLALLFALACGTASAQQADALFARAFDLMQKGEIAVAITMFEEGLRQDPGNGLAHLHLGNALMTQRPPDGTAALLHYRRAAALMPGTTDGIEALARARSLEEKDRRAKTAAGELVGSWELSQRCSWGSSSDRFRIAAVEASGRAAVTEWEGRGQIEDFRVAAGRVEFTLQIRFLGTNTATFRGQVSGSREMSGTFTQTTNPESCRWSARKLD